VIDATQALQDALAAEHAVIYGYAAAGAHLVGPELAGVRTLDRQHRDARDKLADTVRARGADPVTALPAYTLPFPVANRAAALRLLATLEERAAAAYHYLVAAADGTALRGIGMNGLTAAGMAAARWWLRVQPARAAVAFPGQTS
jgi:uncharacterized protein DUF4439